MVQDVKDPVTVTDDVSAVLDPHSMTGENWTSGLHIGTLVHAFPSPCHIGRDLEKRVSYIYPEEEGIIFGIHHIQNPFPAESLVHKLACIANFLTIGVQRQSEIMGLSF